jgi:dTDP-4-dehydrorhamnose 3,5-epimerase
MNVVRPAELPDLALIEPVVHHDTRGYLIETWDAARYREAGIPGPFVLDIHSHSTRGVLRGMHFQHPDGQGKIVRVTHGTIFDVAADVRVGSPTFGRWWAIELSGENHRQLWIPPGFAHGFLTLSPTADVEYRCTTPYASSAAHAFAWNDPTLNVDWPAAPTILSEIDAAAPALATLQQRGVLPTFTDR